MYPENFVNKLMKDAGIHEEWVPDDDHIAAYNNMFAELNDQEREFVEAYYKDGLTLKAVGDRYGKTRERARQVILNAGRKLRNPFRMKWIVDGEHARQEYIDAWNRRFVETPTVKLVSEDDGISALGLSKRSFNALTRWFRCEPTIKELNAVSDAALAKIRNLGAMSVAEIKTSLAEFYGKGA